MKTNFAGHGVGRRPRTFRLSVLIVVLGSAGLLVTHGTGHGVGVDTHTLTPCRERVAQCVGRDVCSKAGVADGSVETALDIPQRFSVELDYMASLRFVFG